MKQEKLFEVDNKWNEEWVGMPEFIQQKADSEYAKVTIRFASKKDLDDLALIKQRLTNKTKSIWFPEIERGLNANKIYVYEP